MTKINPATKEIKKWSSFPKSRYVFAGGCSLTRCSSAEMIYGFVLMQMKAGAFPPNDSPHRRRQPPPPSPPCLPSQVIPSPRWLIYCLNSSESGRRVLCCVAFREVGDKPHTNTHTQVHTLNPVKWFRADIWFWRPSICQITQELKSHGCM